MVWVTLALFVVSFVLSQFLRPSPPIEDARPAGLGDFSFPTATEARVVPLIWGRVKVGGPNVVWYGDLLQVPITEKVKKNLFASKRVIRAYRYHVGIQFGLCRGPGIVLKRIWIGDKQAWAGTLDTDGDTAEIWDNNFFGGDKTGSGGLKTTLEFYTGSTTQSVSAYLGLHQDAGAGTDRTPRYTGTSYLVARGYRTTDHGAYVGITTQMKPWAMELERFPGPWSGQTAGHKIGGKACNPMNVIYEILTDTEWGFGFPAADIDAGGAGTSFDDAASTLESEGNGWAMTLQKVMQSAELIQEIERQIDGKIFLDHRSGKWKVKLARDDYDIDTVPQLSDDNVKEVRDFTRGSYDDTTNQIQVRYWKRETDSSGHVNYKETFAPAQDVGNALIRGGGTVATAQIVSGEVSYPGVKDSALASQIAWRDLRAQAYPLARATFVVTREFWDLTVGSVVAWTSSRFGFEKLPMRVGKIDYGTLQDGQITLSCAQDVFQYGAGSYGTPDDTLWNPPEYDLASYPTDEKVVCEAPRALVVRDPDYGGSPNVAKIFAAARRQAGEVGFWITQRNSSGIPSGDYTDAGQVMGLMLIGELDGDLSAGESNPVSSISITPDPDTDILDEFGAVSDTDMGVDLTQLIMVNDEFMLVKTATDGGATVDLEDVYRGVLDSVQGNHSDGDSVYLLFVGAGLSDGSYPTTNNVYVRLDAFSSQGRYSDTATPSSDYFTFAKRSQRPYPPAAVLYNGTSTEFGTPDMEGDGAGENGYGCDVDWYRRRYDTADEVASMKADDSGVDASHETRLRVFVDPDGADTEIASSPFAWTSGTGSVRIPRNELIAEAAAGTKIRVQLETRHDSPLDSTTLTSRDNFVHDVVPDSDNDGLFYLGGGLGPATATNSYTVASAGVHTVRIGAGYATSNVRVRINGGGWSTIISAGGTSGTTAGLSVSDTIELDHTVSEGPDPQFVEIEDPSTSRVAYGTFSA